MSPLSLTRRAALVLAAWLAAGCASAPPQPSASSDGDPGIRVESLRLSAADYMLDLRFRVTDPARAAPFFSPRTELVLVDPASGARLAVPNTPKLGKLRQVVRSGASERRYFVLFANPGRQVRPGSQLTLVADGTPIARLTVE